MPRSPDEIPENIDSAVQELLEALNGLERSGNGNRHRREHFRLNDTSHLCLWDIEARISTPSYRPSWRCLLGEFTTVEHFPLVIAGRWFAPMLLHEPGKGEIVRGELYQVDHRQLSRLDDLESVGRPGNYRFRIVVEGIGLPEIHFAYFKSPERAVPLHIGFLTSYQDDRFIPPHQRDEAT
jgi:gamma-glutamylaminecyclotransferase